jgi:hypothetical protein
VHWDPVPKGADFQPLLRFAHWSKAQHQRFNWIAGRELGLFGYEPQFTRVGPGARLRNRWEDVAWLARRTLGRNGAANFLR